MGEKGRHVVWGGKRSILSRGSNKYNGSEEEFLTCSKDSKDAGGNRVHERVPGNDIRYTSFYNLQTKQASNKEITFLHDTIRLIQLKHAKCSSKD